MKINPFTLDAINQYNMFFMLQKLDATSINIDLYYQEINNDVLFEDCSLFEMLNGQVLVAFTEYFTHISKHNLVATDGVISEIVSLQIFERIYEHYKHGINTTDAGGFIFMNSAPVPSFQNQWRCDNGLYGVELFADPLGDSTIAVPDAADALLVYEPILSINGVAHLVYIERENKNNKTELMNNSITPFATYSLGEALKLILEWSQVSKQPFNNTELVATKASIFVEKLGIQETFVSDQPDMQIFEYLKGNPSARTRPTGYQELSTEADIFIKKNMSHSCLSSIIAAYPSAANILDIKQIENEKLSKDMQIFELITDLLDPNDKDKDFYIKSRTELFEIKQQILQNI
jgi:hypothetical protein